MDSADYFGIIVSVLGGLAFFLYGMSLLGSGLEKASGGRLERTLEKMSNNIFKAVLFGALVTAAVQSSSATTVIVVGLVNANIIKLKQAIGVIMGANIGTTITAHILSLMDIQSDNFIMNLLKPTSWAPLVSIIGIILYMAGKKAFQKDLGQILLGFGILFFGMFQMSDAVAPLEQVPGFIALFKNFSNPILGVLAGAVVTAIIQSSAASIGILQALTSTGQITFSSAIPIILGQNIGTCITPIMASFGASKNAKRSAFVHLSFNIIGTLIFLFAVYAFQYTIGFSFWNNPINSNDIANFHSIFNVAVTIMLIPFAGLLEKLSIHFIRGDESDESDTDMTASLDDRFLRSPGLAINHASQCVLKMGQLAFKNLQSVTQLFSNHDAKQIEKIRERENLIDKLEDRVSIYLVRLSEGELTEPESRQVSLLLQIQSEFERIGDYAINIQECADHLADSGSHFSTSAFEELKTLSDAVSECIGKALSSFEKNDVAVANSIEPLEEVVDIVEELLKERHIERLKEGQCSVDAAFPFIESLSNYERIADHCANVGMYMIAHAAKNQNIDRHEYRRILHQGLTEYYNDLYQQYKETYYDKVLCIPQS
ncbi:Na/Pi cotransporter family protein [uncultured Negativibacillus sp.]|uniref:Na/Pi cotransporter family protein n=1 Tax=uncultured Negativibacillus sp. TaxID=1980696 RepID=UPI0025EFB8DB|nr:Na/Pi cotransporter family protein [uncultured Negativibacillus sp.]